MAEEWQTAKPRRQQPKRGDWGDPASPPPGQEHQLNGHSVEPLPPPPSPPPPAVAAGEQRAAAAAHRPQSEKLCLKCDDPTHKCVHVFESLRLKIHDLPDCKRAHCTVLPQQACLVDSLLDLQAFHPC